VQFLDRAFGFLDRLHLDEGEAFRSLIVFIADYLGVLDVTDPIEQVEKVALGRVEGKIPHVESR
jgi:hypothetical protein